MSDGRVLTGHTIIKTTNLEFDTWDVICDCTGTPMPMGRKLPPGDTYEHEPLRWKCHHCGMEVCAEVRMRAPGKDNWHRITGPIEEG